MSAPVIRIVTYIASTPEKVWAALTDPDITQQYWFDTRMESDWCVGSKVLWRRKGEITDEQTILAIDPPRSLSYSFHPVFGEFRDEAPSRASFSIADNGQVVRVTMIHDHSAPESKVYPACCIGWPMILSNLKTLLETGRPLADLEFVAE